MGSMTFAALVFLMVAGGQGTPEANRLYGRVVTAGGEVYEGYMRWDQNEGSWADVLNGTKEMPWENERDAERLGGREPSRERRHSVRVLGLHISWTDDEGDALSRLGDLGHPLRACALSGGDR